MNRARGKSVLEKNVTRPEALTNGEVNGYDSYNGFAYFDWPGYCTVDLDDVCDLKSVRLLLWDKQGKGQLTPADRKYKYRLLTSKDAETWNLIYETDEIGTIGWQVFDFDTPHQARYIRVHGLWCSAQPKVHIVELEAHDSSASLPSREPHVHLQLGGNAKLILETASFKATTTMREIIRQLRALPESHPMINPGPLLVAADELELKLDDITQIEERIDAVNRRIVEPVAQELEFGRKAGRFSEMGFWVGFAGILVSLLLFALSVWLQNRSST